jgi:hypothetical protein
MLKGSSQTTQEIDAELRVLEIELLQAIVGNALQYRWLDAFERLRARAPGCEQAEFAHERAGKNIDAKLAQSQSAGNDEKHFVGNNAAIEQDFAGIEFSFVHERLQPVHREIARGRRCDFADQIEHFAQAPCIQWQQDEMQKQDRVGGEKKSVCNHGDVAGETGHAQGHHGAH